MDYIVSVWLRGDTIRQSLEIKRPINFVQDLLRFLVPLNLIKIWSNLPKDKSLHIFLAIYNSIVDLRFISFVAFIDCCSNTLKMMEKHSITKDKFSSPTVAV